VDDGLVGCSITLVEGLIGGYHRFGGTYGFHLQVVTAQKTNIDIFTAVVRTSYIAYFPRNLAA
jgi:hypothetical protein